jgi:hypothetical protein
VRFIYAASAYRSENLARIADSGGIFESVGGGRANKSHRVRQFLSNRAKFNLLAVRWGWPYKYRIDRHIRDKSVM